MSMETAGATTPLTAPDHPSFAEMTAVFTRIGLLRALAARYRINQKTVAKWRKRTSFADLQTGPKDAKSTVLAVDEEVISSRCCLAVR